MKHMLTLCAAAAIGLGTVTAAFADDDFYMRPPAYRVWHRPLYRELVPFRAWPQVTIGQEIGPGFQRIWRPWLWGLNERGVYYHRGNQIVRVNPDTMRIVAVL